jgi:hypothetical protein
MSITTLNKQRSQCLARLTRISTFVHNFDISTTDAEALLIRDNAIDSIALEHSDIIAKLTDIVTEQDESKLDESIDKFDNLFYSLKTLLKVKLTIYGTKQQQLIDHTKESEHIQRKREIKLPDVQIPEIS